MLSKRSNPVTNNYRVLHVFSQGSKIVSYSHRAQKNVSCSHRAQKTCPIFSQGSKMCPIYLPRHQAGSQEPKTRYYTSTVRCLAQPSGARSLALGCHNCYGAPVSISLQASRAARLVPTFRVTTPITILRALVASLPSMPRRLVPCVHPTSLPRKRVFIVPANMRYL